MKKLKSLLILPILLTMSCNSCNQNTSNKTFERVEIDDNYENYYQIFVYSFADSNNDGIGDLNGVKAKIPYLSSLGYTGIWLTPIFSSSSYHKYDTTNYFSIDKDFGTFDDLTSLVEECHKYNMKILLDGVFNHSGTSCEYFTKALLAHRKYLAGESLTEEEEKYQDLYVFVDNEKDKLSGRKYSKAGANPFYYECNFSTNMPEFNFDNELTYTIIKQVIDFYMENYHIDGFRLDAVIYYYLNDTKKNVEVLNRIADMIHAHNGYVVCEAWVGSQTLHEYYTSKIDSYFYFPGAGSSGSINTSLGFLGAYKENYLNGLLDAIEMAKDNVPAIFLDNHDMPRVSRGGSKITTKFLLGLRDMATGSTFNYYGDELGMSSSNKPLNTDYEDSCYRTHYYWDDSTHEYECFNPQYSSEQTNYFGDSKSQLEDENSILNYEKNALMLRNAFKSIPRGKISVEESDKTINADIDNTLLLAFNKTYEDENLKLVFNFSSTNTYEYSLGEYKLTYTLLADTTIKEKVKNNQLSLPPYSIAVLQK